MQVSTPGKRWVYPSDRNSDKDEDLLVRLVCAPGVNLSYQLYARLGVSVEVLETATNWNLATPGILGLTT